MAGLPPPPTNDQTGSFAWLEWFRQLRGYISQTGSVPWNVINFAGSNITDIAARSHENLQGIQGGTTSQHYHLTSAEYAALTAGPHNNLTGLQGGTSSEYYHLTNSKYGEVNTNLNLSGTSGTGVKIDLASPTFGWRDIIGSIETRSAGGGGSTAIPDFVAYRGNIYQYRFGTAAPANHMHEAFINFHIPHDYVPGTDLYMHVHWSQITVDTGGTAGVPGVAKWYFDISYADGHGTAGGAADAFVAPITQSVTQQASTTQYGHMIAEVAFTNNGGDATHFDRNTIAVDGIIQLRVYRDPADAADTLNQDTFVHTCDVHYQSHNLATKNKAPSFYV